MQLISPSRHHRQQNAFHAMSIHSAPSIRKALALATLALMGAANAQETNGFSVQAIPEKKPVAALIDNAWRLDFSWLRYAETDRISVTAPIVFLRKQLSEDASLGVKVVYDTITGASPSGASATTTTQTIQTVTGASGSSKLSSDTVSAYQTPLHSTSDKRIALSADWEKPFSDSTTTRAVYSASVSNESDYSSVGGGASFMHDINDKLTTITAGLSLSVDRVNPGTIPVPMELVSVAYQRATKAVKINDASKSLDPHRTKDDDDDHEGDSGENEGKRKTTVDAMIGLTHILSRRSLLQVNYTVGKSSGYLTDPYKIISVIDGRTGATTDYRYESRPDSRLRQSLYFKTNYNFDHDVVSVSYRYYWDDWSIKAHTIDAQYRLELGSSFYIQPHGRYAKQRAADFYRHSLIDSPTLPHYASADYRLGDLSTITTGLKAGYRFTADHEASLRFESMTQRGDSHPSNAIGVQKQVDLFPTVKATIAQVSYTAKF